ncbi:lipid-A-disaccharide synthase [Nitratifractor sp.]
MKLLVSALEHSANLHLAELKKHLPESMELEGIFSAELGEPIVDLRSLAIMGFVDALKKLPFFYRLADRMVEQAADADKVLLMDASGFNLPLAKKIKKRYPDKEILYYILPQAWAWRKGRIPVLARTCDRLLSILPFESAHYPAEAPIEYVGHPLLDEIDRFRGPEESRSTGIIAYLPGSRRGEIRRLMPHFRTLRRRLPEHEARIVIPPYFDAARIRDLYGDLSGFIPVHDTHSTLYESDFAFICSGTATLEAALIGTPFVLAYRAKALDAFLARRLVDLQYAGLANLFSLDFQGRPMHPELLQEDLSVDALLKAYETFDTRRYLQDVQKLRAYLGGGSSVKVARIIMERQAAS